MASKRFKQIIIGLFLTVLIYVGTAILNNFIENKLLASLIVCAVIGAYPLVSLFRALFSYEEGEENAEATLFREIKEYIEQKRKNKAPQ